MFIPRALWADKPTRHFWNKFGIEYGYLGEDDKQTSVAVSYLAEAYMNFGYTGLYACAAFIGLFLVALERFARAFLPGTFFFTFIIFLGSAVHYAMDLGSMLNATVIAIGTMFLFRAQLLKMARRDEYT
jgi:hypothetical protein